MENYYVAIFKKIQFTNGLNITGILKRSINSDCKFCLSNDVFRFRQNLLINSTFLVQIHSVPMEIAMVCTVFDS